MPSKALVERDERGLTLLDRRLLQEIALTGSWQQAADALGLTRRQVRERFKIQSFKEQYDAIFDSEEIQATKRELELVATGTGKLYEEALNAEKTRNVATVCPDCGHKFSIFVQVVDWMARLKAGETLLKLTKLLKDERKVQVEGQVGVVHMSAGEYLALQRLRMGLPVPEHIYRRLQALSQSSEFDLPPMPDVVDGTYREVEHVTPSTTTVK